MQNLNSRKFPMMLAALAMSAESAESAGSTAEGEQPKEKKPGVGDLAKQLLREGKSNKEVLDAVKAAFPESKTSMSSINWYRNHLRGLGEDVKTARDIAAAGKPSREELKAQKDAAKAEKKAQRDADRQAKKDAKAAEKKAAKEKAKAEKAEGEKQDEPADMLA